MLLVPWKFGVGRDESHVSLDGSGDDDAVEGIGVGSEGGARNVYVVEMVEDVNGDGFDVDVHFSEEPANGSRTVKESDFTSLLELENFDERKR